MRVGVLALQGAFRAHELTLAALGVDTLQVRMPDDLVGVDALVMPGGESTTMARLLTTSALFEPLQTRIEAGMPTFGTCAGMILLAAQVADGRADQRSFAALDIAVRRNGFGRQIDSFETDLAVAGLDEPFHAVFIRAPRIERCGADVEVLARYGDEPVFVRHATVFASSFHPELTADGRLHALFLASVSQGV